MQYKELFNGDNQLITNIFKANFPDDYKAIFGDTQPTYYDTVALLKWGNREVCDTITPDNCKDVVSAVIAINVDGWIKASTTMQKEFDALQPVRRSTTTTGKGTDNQTANNANTESVKAFNDTDFTPDNKNETNNTTERTTTDERTETVTGFDGDIYTQLRKDFAFRLDNWRENIIFAIVNEITLSIY